MDWLGLGLILVIPRAMYGMIKKPKELDFPITIFGGVVLVILLVYFTLLGGKLTFLFFQKTALSLAKTAPGDPNITGAGIAYMGVFVFQMIVLAGFCKLRKNRTSFMTLGDYLLPFFMLAGAFARMGCFSNQCCYGKPTDLPWGVVFPKVSTMALHPTQLYMVIGLVAIFVLMRFLYRRKPPVGIVFFSTIGLYNFFRFFVEFLRVDSITVYNGITLAQIASFSIFSICVLFFAGIMLKAKIARGKQSKESEIKPLSE